MYQDSFKCFVDSSE